MELGIIYIFVVAVGLCIGSFLNVVVSRAFSSESIVFPASKCPRCQTPLKWWHNVPVLSFLLLRGRCSYCKESISLQYPLVEIVTAILFAGVFWKFQFSIETLFMIAIVSLFVVIAVTDLREKVVFDMHTIALILVGMLYSLFNFSNLGNYELNVGAMEIGLSISLVNSVAGAIAGYIVMELLARSGYLLAKTRAFGEGDSYIASGLGAILGVGMLAPVLICSIAIQLCFIVPLFLKKLYNSKDFKTFGGFLIFLVMAIVSKFFGQLASNLIIYIPFMVVFIGLGVYSCRRILAGMDKQMTYLPFGPAMILAGLIFILIK